MPLPVAFQVPRNSSPLVAAAPRTTKNQTATMATTATAATMMTVSVVRDRPPFAAAGEAEAP